jgi:hypothetical protein
VEEVLSLEVDEEGEDPLSFTRKCESTRRPPDLGSRARCQVRDSGGGEVGADDEDEDEEEGGVIDAVG